MEATLTYYLAQREREQASCKSDQCTGCCGTLPVALDRPERGLYGR